MKDTDYYVGQLENITDWLEENISKLAELKMRQIDVVNYLEQRKAELAIMANETDSDGKMKLKNAELRDAFVTQSLKEVPEFTEQHSLQRDIIAKEAVIRSADYSFKAMVAILGVANKTKEIAE